MIESTKAMRPTHHQPPHARLRLFTLVSLLSILFPTTDRAVARDWVVAIDHPAADDAGPGTADQPFRSIAPAALAAQPGDVVLVHPGIYRERVMPARGGEPDRPITYRAAVRGQAIIKGSDVFAPEWQPIATGSDLYRVRLDPALFKGDNPFRRSISIEGRDTSRVVRPTQGELIEVLGELFVDGVPYQQVLSASDVEKTANSWLVEADGEHLLIHFPGCCNPAKSLCELTTRRQIFAPQRRGLGHIHLEGFIFEHCANQGPFPQAGAVSTRSGRQWRIEGCTIRYAATIGLDCGSESWDGPNLPETIPAEQRVMIGGGHVIRDNDISDNGLCGIAGWNHQGTRIEHNRIERNNRRGFPHGKGWEEWAGIKLHAADAVIQHNLIRDNRGFGIWIDNGHAGVQIVHNIIVRNRLAGVFIELGASPDRPGLIAGNIIGETSGEGFYPGFGVYTHDASDLVVAHNLIYGHAETGVMLRTITDRQAGGKVVETSRTRLVNNILAFHPRAISLPYPSTRSAALTSDYNLFGSSPEGRPLLFALNKYQGTFAWKDAHAALAAALSTADEPDGALPRLSDWQRDPIVPLAGWRTALDQDVHSRVGPIRVVYSDLKLPPQLELSIAPELLTAEGAPRVAGYDRDFLGEPLPEKGAVPGPFQRIPMEAGAKIVLEMTK